MPAPGAAAPIRSRPAESSPRPALLGAASPPWVQITPLEGAGSEDEDEEVDENCRDEGAGEGSSEGEGEEDRDEDKGEDKEDKDEGEDEGRQRQSHPQMTPALVIMGPLPQAPIPGFSGPFTPSHLSSRPWNCHLTQNVLSEIHRYFPHQYSQERFCWNYTVLSPSKSS
jgi:hypothetical protein